eukprot:24089-Lingulodinium_polyedra.AAC.1
MGRVGETCLTARFDPDIPPLSARHLRDIVYVCATFVDLDSGPFAIWPDREAKARLTAGA